MAISRDTLGVSLHRFAELCTVYAKSLGSSTHPVPALTKEVFHGRGEGPVARFYAIQEASNNHAHRHRCHH